jgi:hypothetical protein
VTFGNPAPAKAAAPSNPFTSIQNQIQQQVTNQVANEIANNIADSITGKNRRPPPPPQQQPYGWGRPYKKL